MTAVAKKSHSQRWSIINVRHEALVTSEVKILPWEPPKALRIESWADGGNDMS
jgi:hypothetical protein